MSWRSGLLLLTAAILSFGSELYASEKLVLPCEAYLTAQGVTKPDDLLGRYLWRSFTAQFTNSKIYSEQSFERAVLDSYHPLLRLRASEGVNPDPEAEVDVKMRPVLAWLDRAQLRESLKGYIEQINSNRSKWPAKFYYAAERVLQFRVTKILSLLSGNLPDLPDRKLQSDLLAEIQQDGVVPHLGELSALYEALGQRRVDNYRRMQRALRPILLVAALTLGYMNTQYTIEQQSLVAKNQVTVNLDTINDGLDKIDQMLDQGRFKSNTGNN